MGKGKKAGLGREKMGGERRERSCSHSKGLSQPQGSFGAGRLFKVDLNHGGGEGGDGQVFAPSYQPVIGCRLPPRKRPCALAGDNC